MRILSACKHFLNRYTDGLTSPDGIGIAYVVYRDIYHGIREKQPIAQSLKKLFELRHLDLYNPRRSA